MCPFSLLFTWPFTLQDEGHDIDGNCHPATLSKRFIQWRLETDQAEPFSERLQPTEIPTRVHVFTTRIRRRTSTCLILEIQPPIVWQLAPLRKHKDLRRLPPLPGRGHPSWCSKHLEDIGRILQSQLRWPYERRCHCYSQHQERRSRRRQEQFQQLRPYKIHCRASGQAARS